ncbi:DUF7519 family protein [Halomontanus rarus]|uniref:DUF7519 family protein n=1 Tax=Halomontanus rarus TaxID=3034020 RepID=UPI0023E7885E|nr:hypothetical protein [Halovivax sp. TS33]
MSGLPATPTESFPTTRSAGVALVAAIGACFAGSRGPLQSAPLLLEAAGIVVFVGGVVFRRRGRRIAGRTLTLVGGVVAGSALVGAVALSLSLPVALAVLSCGIGVASLTLAVFPVIPKWERTLALTGATLVFVGVTANAVVGDLPVWRSATAVTMVFLAWDGAERAIALGERIGDGAETASVELTGTATSTIVALAAIGLTVAVSRLPTGNSPSSPAALALLLVATIAFFLGLAHLPRSPRVDD